MKRLDIWLGKTLFHPPIIALCHATRQTQYAIHRAFWFFAALHATYYAKDDGWVTATIVWLWVIVSFIDAVAVPDRHATSYGFMRAFYWFFFLIGVIGFITLGDLSSGTVRALMILFAEYAATIKTLPPRRSREKRASGKAVKA